MVGDEGVGGATVAGRIPTGLWATKGSDTVVLEGVLDVESVLEGLDLTDPCVFGGGDSTSATVVNLYRSSVSQRRVILEGILTSWVT